MRDSITKRGCLPRHVDDTCALACATHRKSRPETHLPGIGLRECPNFSRNTPAIAIQHVGQEAIAGDNLSSTVRGRDKHWQFAGSGL
jgi:hypothetical protein